MMMRNARHNPEFNYIVCGFVLFTIWMHFFIYNNDFHFVKGGKWCEKCLKIHCTLTVCLRFDFARFVSTREKKGRITYENAVLFRFFGKHIICFLMGSVLILKNNNIMYCAYGRCTECFNLINIGRNIDFLNVSCIFCWRKLKMNLGTYILYF